MKRTPRPDEVRLWAMVASTVRPAPGRHHPVAPSEDTPEPKAKTEAAPRPFVAEAHRTQPQRLRQAAPDIIEPGRKRRIVRERDPLDVRLDLHGLDQDKARAVLHGFLLRAQADGVRAVLVITGKGFQGDGILRRRCPEWLAEPGLRTVVAGVSEAARHHGGEGALYVALKRRPG